MDSIKNNENCLIEAKITDFLNESSISYNTLKPKEKKHLINIEKSLTKVEERYSILIKELKDNKPSISSISDDAGISSRQTIYNNPVLKNYITDRINQILKGDVFFEIEYLKCKVKDLNEKVNAMVDRDIDTEILRYEVKQLKEQLKAREGSIELLEQQSIAKTSEIYSLKNQIKQNESSESTSNTKKTVPSTTVLKFNTK